MKLGKAQYIRPAGVAIGLAVIIMSYLLLPHLPPSGGQGQAPNSQGEMSKIVLFKKPWPAPMASFLDKSGDTIDLSRFRGKVVLLNFWATWCYPCLLEMPSLDSLQTEFGGRQFVVVALSIDRGLADVKRFYRTHELAALDHYIDPVGTVGQAFRLRGVPASFIIDHNGLVRGYFPGPADWNSTEARAVLRHYIARITGDEDITKTTGVKLQPE